MIEKWEQTGPPDIEPHELVLGEKLGEGQFGTVYRGTCRGKEVAIKRLFKQDLDAETLADFKKEVEIMARLRHPNTLLFMGACTSPGNMSVVTEFLAGDVEGLLKKKDVDLSVYTRMRMLKEMCQGMNWLHESKPQIIHRDLKPANLLVDANLTVKVCDFGLSAVKENKAEKLQDKDAIPGTPLFLAPEVLLGNPFDASSDVYSFAITAWEVFCKTEAFSDFNNFGTFKRAVCTRDVRPPLKPEMPKRFQDLLERCWNKDPAVRPKFGEIITILDEIMIDVAIKDPAANAFWKANFRGREKLGWDRLAEKLAEYVGVSAHNLSPDFAEKMRFFRFMVGVPLPDVHNPPKEVKLEDFGRFFTWFGPFDKQGHFLDAVRTAMKEDWFHGHMSSKDAEKALANRKKGTFLVRLSATAEGVFSISRVGSTGISHQRMNYDPTDGTFSLKFSQGKTQKKIKEKCSLSVFIVKHLSKELKLAIACAGSPFGFLSGKQATFEKGTDVDGYAVVNSDSE